MSAEPLSLNAVTLTNMNAFLTAAAGDWNGSPAFDVEANDGYHGLVIRPNSGVSGQVFFEMDGWGTGHTPFIVTLFGQGTSSSPSGVLSGNGLMNFTAAAQYDTTVGHSHEAAAINVVATENWDATHHGCEYNVSTILNGATNLVVRQKIDSGGHTRIQNGTLALDQGYTVATLPASPTLGMHAVVTDGTASLAWGATVTGGASTKYLVWYNGTAWTVVGK